MQIRLKGYALLVYSRKLLKRMEHTGMLNWIKSTKLKIMNGSKSWRQEAKKRSLQNFEQLR